MVSIPHRAIWAFAALKYWHSVCEYHHSQQCSKWVCATTLGQTVNVAFYVEVLKWFSKGSSQSDRRSSIVWSFIMTMWGLTLLVWWRSILFIKISPYFPNCCTALTWPLTPFFSSQKSRRSLETSFWCNSKHSRTCEKRSAQHPRSSSSIF